MTDVGKLARLLDDPEVRVVVFGLAHASAAAPSAEPGAPRLRAVVLQLADTTDPDQYRSWLTDNESRSPMTIEQVRLCLGDDAIDEIASYAGSSPADVASQLAAVLPDLVDAVSPGGNVIDARELDKQVRAAIAADDQSAGPFGLQAH